MRKSTRRMALMLGACDFVATFVKPLKALASGTVAVANVVTYGADPTGANSSVVAFNSAFSVLLSTGGEIYVPPGHYLLDSPLVFSGAPVTLKGEGAGVSVLIITHSNTALSFNQVQSYHTVSVRDIGLAAVPSGSPSALALSISMPYANISNTPSCQIANLELYNDGISKAAFKGGLYLNNVWRSHILNVSNTGSSPIVPGSYHIAIDGFSIDNQIVDCSVNSVDTAFIVMNSARTQSPQGLHIINPIVASSNTGFSSGASLYATSNYNVLELYIKGGEFGCNTTALNLTAVISAFITDTHFGNSNTPAAPTCMISGCRDVEMTNCLISGSSGSTPSTGITFVNLGTQYSVDNIIDSCEFVNLTTAVMFGAAVYENSALNMRVINPANFPNYLTAGVAVDNSGNTLNQAAWLTGATGTARFGYLH